MGACTGVPGAIYTEAATTWTTIDAAGEAIAAAPVAASVSASVAASDADATEAAVVATVSWNIQEGALVVRTSTVVRNAALNPLLHSMGALLALLVHLPLPSSVVRMFGTTFDV